MHVVCDMQKRVLESCAFLFSGSPVYLSAYALHYSKEHGILDQRIGYRCERGNVWKVKQRFRIVAQRTKPGKESVRGLKGRRN